MPTLHSPLVAGTLSCANRIWLAPLTRTRASADNVPGDLMAEYYRQRASGGLLIAEATMVAADALAWPHQPGIHSQAQVAGWKKVTDAVHADGGRIILQIWHPGRATHPDLNAGVQPVSSSDKPIRGDGIYTPSGKQPYPAPRPLRTDEVPGIVEHFRRAAQNAKAAGFDGVQVHGAHGYLVDQFLRDGVNDRTDAYGGSVGRRCRLLAEILDAVIPVFGAGAVSLRISPLVAFNDMADSNPPALVAEVARLCQERKLGFLELRHADPAAPAEAQLVAVARQHYAGVLARNGGFTRESAEAALESGAADAIVFGTSFLANPDLPERFRLRAPLNAPDMATFYARDAKGYTDYPAMR